MANDVNRLGLEETIGALRRELVASSYASQGEGLRFEVGEVTVELHVEVERSLEAKSGIKFWVVELGGGGGEKDKSIHKVSIPLKPVRRDGKPVLTGSDEVPE
ncbi:trypco2 family protein [Alkalinema pantanalense CENA528]|uniref:trypco2 family protein n=1 Tax=Alkalinema pantanalense TaxID=1620705 RepID=UPI003D6EE038